MFVKWTGFQERYKIANVWEDDVYIIIDQPYKDNPVYTVENQTDKSTKTVHRDLLLPLPTILDWMWLMEPDILVKPIKDDPGVEDQVKSENETSSDEEDPDLSGDEAIYTHTWTRHEIKKSKPEIQGEMRVANINEPSEQEIDRQSDSDLNSYQSADNGSDEEDGQGDIHSTPLAQESQLVPENWLRNIWLYTWTNKTAECYFEKPFTWKSFYCQQKFSNLCLMMVQ